MLVQVAVTHGDWADSAVKIVQIISAIILAYLAYLQKKGGEQQIATAKAAGDAATSAQSSASSAKELVATVAVQADKQGTQLTAMQEEGHKTHVLVNSQKTFLEGQNKGLRALLSKAGVAIPPELISTEPPQGLPPFPPA